MLVASRHDVMDEHRVTGSLRWLGWLSAALRGAAAAALLASGWAPIGA